MDPKSRTQFIRAVFFATIILLAFTTLVQVALEQLRREGAQSTPRDLAFILPARILEALLFVVLYRWTRDSLPGRTPTHKGLALAAYLAAGIGISQELIVLAAADPPLLGFAGGLLGHVLGYFGMGLVTPTLLKPRPIYLR